MQSDAYFVSDLHLFCRRSVADRHLSDLHAAAESASTFVFGGDIFDFKWSTFGTHTETADQAIAWIANFIGEHEECQFHYLLGNHDCNPYFVDQLDRLANSVTNLTWHRHLVVFDKTVCLHGDVADRFTTQSQLEAKRARWSDEHDRRRVLGNYVYDAAVAARLHRAVPMILHHNQAVARRLLRYLEEHGYVASDSLTHVYFGHTHTRAQFTYEGVSFRNGGAPIKGLSFEIVPAEIATPHHDASL